MNILICYCSSFVPSDVYKDNKRRRNSHEIICGKKFANEIEDGKQTVVGNKYKPRPRPHSTSRLCGRGSDYLNALEDNDIKYFCQNTLRLSSLKSFTQTQPKIFCIEKSNIIVLPSLRNEVEDFSNIKETKEGYGNIFNENNKIQEINSNDVVDFVNPTNPIHCEKDCTTNPVTQGIKTATHSVIEEQCIPTYSSKVQETNANENSTELVSGMHEKPI